MYNVSAELKIMEAQMFREDLFQTVLAECRQNPPDSLNSILENMYDENKSFLDPVLDEEQKCRLSEMEDLFLENCRDALRLGFTRGLCAAFHEYFAEDPPDHPFEKLVAERLLKGPQQKKFALSYRRRRRLDGIHDLLREPLSMERQSDLDNIIRAWEYREHGFLLHGYYLGYRFALAVAGDAAPIPGYEPSTRNLLLLEHELGFIHTMEELERRRKRESAAT